MNRILASGRALEERVETVARELQAGIPPAEEEIATRALARLSAILGRRLSETRA